MPIYLSCGGNVCVPNVKTFANEHCEHCKFIKLFGDNLTFGFSRQHS